MRPWTLGDLLLIVLIGAVICLIMTLVNRSRRTHPAKQPAVPDPLAGDEMLRSILTQCRSIAMVGVSADPARPSHQVMAYLLRAGYTVYPVNPGIPEILGLKTFSSLAELPQAPDVVDVFRKPTEVPNIAREAVTLGARVLWLQEGVVSPEGMGIARQGGMKVVMDHCLMKEHRRLLGSP